MKVRVQNHALYMVVFAMAAVALETLIASGRYAATTLHRRGMIPPRRCNTRNTRRMSAARFTTGIQLPRISTTVTNVQMTKITFRLPMTKVRRWTVIRGIQVFEQIDI